MYHSTNTHACMHACMMHAACVCVRARVRARPRVSMHTYPAPPHPPPRSSQANLTPPTPLSVPLRFLAAVKEMSRVLAVFVGAGGSGTEDNTTDKRPTLIVPH